MNSVIDLGWHQTEEGQGALAHLRDPITGAPKRIFGILEVRFLPNKLLTIKYYVDSAAINEHVLKWSCHGPLVVLVVPTW